MDSSRCSLGDRLRWATSSAEGWTRGWVEGEPAMVGRLPLTLSCNLAVLVEGGATLWLVGVVFLPDELSESTRLTVAAERAGTCIGGKLTCLAAASLASSLLPTVLPRLRVMRLLVLLAMLAPLTLRPNSSWPMTGLLIEDELLTV